jgi:hypothetical protein
MTFAGVHFGWMNESEPKSVQAPPRAFTQGVGTVFQFAGVGTFVLFMFVCCISALLSKQAATGTPLGTVGWGGYTAQRAVSIGMVVGVLMGMSWAGIGLGLQAQRRWSATAAVSTCVIAGAFWIVHSVFFVTCTGSIALSTIAIVLSLLCVTLLGFAIAGFCEMQRDRPPPKLEVLPADYKVPYSHLHEDPPEIRLARELEQRRQKLEVQQKELEMLEEKLKRKMKQTDS